MKYRRLTNDYPKKPVDNTGYVGAPAIKGDMCQKCHFCAQNCPSQAITIDEAGYPNIHIDQCIYCSFFIFVNNCNLYFFDSSFNSRSDRFITLSFCSVNQDSFLCGFDVSQSVHLQFFILIFL